MTRYLDATRCALIADALAALSPADADSADIAEQLESMFRDRAAPGAGVILTIPGEEG